MQIAFLILILGLASALPTATNIQADEEQRFICFGENDCSWMTLEEALIHRESHKKDCSDFIDFTDAMSLLQAPTVRKQQAFPLAPTKQNIVRPFFEELSSANLNATVSKMSSFLNRYYTASTGSQSMEWIKSQFDSLPNVKTELFRHAKFSQPSVIARIEGTETPEQIVVIGAHGDSISGRGGATTQAPGADDDASGVANLLEVARVIAHSANRPKKTIEFMVYAAEEVGLLGSLDIAKSYSSKGIDLYAVYQIEMSGYTNPKNTPAVTLIVDYVDKDLVAFTKTLVQEYLTLPVKEIKCGYGCSDHASFYNAGFPDVCAAEAGPFDSNLNPNMHKVTDLPQVLNFEHCKEFAKLAVSFAVELAY